MDCAATPVLASLPLPFPEPERPEWSPSGGGGAARMLGARTPGDACGSDRRVALRIGKGGGTRRLLSLPNELTRPQQLGP